MLNIQYTKLRVSTNSCIAAFCIYPTFDILYSVYSTVVTFAFHKYVLTSIVIIQQFSRDDRG